MISTLAAITEHSDQTGHGLLLLLILAETNGKAGPKLPDLMRLLDLGKRQTQRIIKDLEAKGDIHVTRGIGKGHSSVYTIPYLPVITPQSDKVTSESPLQKVTSAEPMPSQKVTSTPPLSDRKVTHKSPYPLKGDAQVTPNTGTEVAPSKAETISSNTTQPPPSAPVDADAKASRTKVKSAALDKLTENDRKVIEAWRELLNTYPRRSVWPYILKRLTPSFDRERFERCGGAYLANFGMGQQHVAGICDWYSRNQTERYETGPPGRAGNVEKGLNAVKSFIAKEQSRHVN